jgi:CDP-diacylglycerol--glycerol-3-phosphate 3-phosphatidyltransferase
MLDRRVRPGVERGLGPLGANLRRIGVSADVLTVVGLLVSAATALLIASGHLLWAVVGVGAAGGCDLLDGAVARGSGQVSRRGSFFDSVVDRVSDALLMIGVAWYLLGGSSPYDAVLAMAVMAATMVISYERAKAESLGLSARGGLMERAERLVALGIALAFDVLVPVLWIMLALTVFTAGYRFARVWRQAERPPRPVIQPRTVPRADRPPARMWWGTRRARWERRRRPLRPARRP